MSTLLSQADFDRYAAAWARFLDRAALRPNRIQRLFTLPGQDGRPPQYQANVTFDVATDVAQLLSTPGIARVMARFVLLPKAEADREALPRFRAVLFAVDGLGGRISAYFLGSAVWYNPPARLHTSEGDLRLEAGPVPFNLIRTWLVDWRDAALGGKLEADIFTTPYGPLQGYNFELSDIVNPLFTAGSFDGKTLQINFGLKHYYPAYPDSPPQLSRAFGLIVRLYTGANVADPLTQLDEKNQSGEGGGPSYDMGAPIPPGH